MRIIYLIVVLFVSLSNYAQDAKSIFEEGRKLEQKFKDVEALEKYGQAFLIDSQNIQVLVKLAEISCAAAAKQSDPILMHELVGDAKKYAAKAQQVDSTNAEVNYILAYVYIKMANTDIKKEEMVKCIRAAKYYADKAVAATPSLGKAYNVLGKWHYEMESENELRKAAIKLFYGKIPESNIDTAIANFEKCKILSPYYCRNFLDLAKAYNYTRKYEMAIAALQQLAKLPVKNTEDADIKKEGIVLLQKLQ